MKTSLYRAGGLACALLASTSMLAVAPQAAFAQEVIPPKAYVTTPGGINVADGSFVYSVTDLAIGPLTLERFHLSGSRKGRNPFFGKNMSHNFDIYVASNRKLNPASLKPIVHIGNSASGVYGQSSNLLNISANNQDAASGILEWSGTSSWSGGNYVYTDKSGTIYTFSRTVSAEGVAFESQRVAQITFADGRVQTFSYNAGGQLKLVEDSSGYAIVFDYNAGGDVSAACGFNRSQSYVTSSSTCAGAALKTSYGYDANGYLVSAVDVLGQTTSYGNAVPGITCVTPPGYSSCKMSMAYSGDRVATQTLADGGAWSLGGWDPTMLNDPDQPAPYDGHNEASLTDPAGKVTDFTFTKTSPYTMIDANGNITQYLFTGAHQYDDTGAVYTDGTLLIEATLPEGNKYLAEYTGPFNGITKQTLVAKPGSGLPDRVQQLGYGPCSSPGTRQNCGKPAWIRDAKGNQTDFTYASHGGLLTEMKPAPTAGAPRPLKVLTYVQRYAYIKDAAGSLVQAAAPIWLPATETVCQTASWSNSPTCDGGAPQTVTTFEYGPAGTANSLRLLGTLVSGGGVSARTCRRYDEYGRQISETGAGANLSSCPS